jgi:hypothetical protein
MKCPKCVALGIKSKVAPLGAYSTLMNLSHRFYDEEGVYHDHTPSQRMEQYRCSNGHEWNVHGRNSCPEKDWEDPELPNVTISSGRSGGKSTITYMPVSGGQPTTTTLIRQS